MGTSRERHKSAPYLRLKNSKRTSKCQVFFAVPKKPKNCSELTRRGPASAGPWGAKRGDLFGFLNIYGCKHKKLREGPIEGTTFQKESHNAEETERGTHWGFSTSIMSQNIEGGTLWGKQCFEKMSHKAKKLKRGLFSPARYYMLREKNVTISAGA